MNRLLITILLVLVFAFGIAKIAQGQEAPPAPKDTTTTASTTAATSTATGTDNTTTAQPVIPPPKPETAKTEVAKPVHAPINLEAEADGKTYVGIVTFDAQGVRGVDANPKKCKSKNCKMDLSPFKDAFQKVYDSEKDSDDILKTALKEKFEEEIEATNQQKEEKKNLDADLQRDKDLCKVTDASKVTKDDDGNPIRENYYYDAKKGKKSSDGSSNRSTSSVASDLDDTDADSKTTSTDEEAIVDDPLSSSSKENPFTEKDRCYARKSKAFLEKGDTDKAQALINLQTKELLNLDAKFARGELASDSAEMKRYQSYQAYMSNMLKDKKIAGMISKSLTQQAIASDANVRKLAGIAGANPVMAAQYRSAGGQLSDDAIHQMEAVQKLAALADTAAGNAQGAAQLAAIRGSTPKNPDNDNLANLIKTMDKTLAGNSKDSAAEGDSYIADYERGRKSAGFNDPASSISDTYDNADKKVQKRTAWLKADGSPYFNNDSLYIGTEPGLVSPSSSWLTRSANFNVKSLGTGMSNATAYQSTSNVLNNSMFTTNNGTQGTVATTPTYSTPTTTQLSAANQSTSANGFAAGRH